MTGTGTENDPYIVSNWTDFVTAIGTNEAYVEFPKQLSLTTDTEIKKGKLYVDSNGDVVVNPTIAGLSTYYENTFKLDQNNYYPEGLTNYITFSCHSFNGCGGVIANLYSLDTNVFRHVAYTVNDSIKNVVFKNVRNARAQSFISRNSTAYGAFSFSGVMLSVGIDVAVTTAVTLFDGRISLQKSAVNVLANNNGTVNINTSGSENTAYNNIEIIGENASFVMHNSQNTMIKGKVHQLTANNCNYSVADLEADTITGSNNSAAIANSDKCSSITDFTSVTSAQMIDAAYLSSIGFPIQT